MSAGAPEIESLLRRALAPVEPPEGLSQRLEGALVSLTDLAVEELDAWELSAMKDPRNWARPAAAVVVGATAGTALVILRVRGRQQRRRQRSQGLLERAERTVRDLVEEATRVVGR